jgi:broad specificity phosphatase PhoE
MRLIMIRHGRPEWQPPLWVSLSRFERISVGYDAAHLSREGMSAIVALAKRLPKALILSSDLPRARETAGIIGRGSGTIEFDPVFREVQTPRITTRLLGRLWAPAAVWALTRRCCWILGIGQCSEWPGAAWNRTAKATDEILKHFETEADIILVSHGWFMVMLALHLRWRGLIERGPLIPKVGFGAMTEYRIRSR